MIRLEIELEFGHRGVMSLCAIEDKTAVVLVVSYLSVLRNPVGFKALAEPEEDIMAYSPDPVSSLAITRPPRDSSSFCWQNHEKRN